jgi:hypothetical protein
MGQCGCGDTAPERGYQIKGTRTVVAYQVFTGCRDCDYGPGVALSFYDSPKVEWLDGVPLEKVQPDKYGANEGRGVGVGLFDMEDLRAEARALNANEASIGPGNDQYATLEDWLYDYGQRLISGAMRRYEKRVRRAAPPSGRKG